MSRAPAATIEALMYGLSIRNTAALQEVETRKRLARLSVDQLGEVCERLLRLDPEMMRRRAPTARPWMEDEIQQLVQAKREVGRARQTRGGDAEETA